MVELRQLRIFIAVAENLSFSRAAEQQLLPQSVVSLQIKKLETALQVRLFDRTHRQVRLTPAGATVLEYARRILDQTSQLIAAVIPTSVDAPAPAIRLGVGTGMGRRLTVITREMSARGYSLEAIESAPARRSGLVISGKAHAAIVRARSPRPGLHRVPLWEDRVVAAVSARSPLAERVSVTAADLGDAHAVLVPRDRNPALNDLVATHWAQYGVTLRTSGEFSSPEMAFARIAATANELWAPIYAGYQARGRHDGIAIVDIDPRLTVETSLLYREPFAGMDELITAARLTSEQVT